MLVIQVVESEGSGHPSEPQPPPSTAQPTNKEPILTVVSSSHQKTQTPRVGRAITTIASLDSVQASGGSPRYQEAIGGSIAQTRSDKVRTQSYDSPLLKVNTLGSDKGIMTLHDVMVLCTQLSNKAESLEIEFKKTKQTYGADFTKLIKKERKIDEIDQDPDITLVQHHAEIQGRHRKEMEFETEVYTAEDVSTTSAAVTTAGASISTASPPRVFTAKDISTTKTLVYIRRSAAKDKGKAKIDESKPEQTKTKLQQRQERAGYEAAIRLQEQLDEEERKRISRVHEEASSFNIEKWEDIQVTIKADKELAQRIQAKEREKYFEAEKQDCL
ncbi:hypothetical protein Tco_0912742 [Tanacetum coccineum]